jgi:hypothetical protein
MKNKHTFGQIIQIDELLLQLSVYEVGRGLMPIEMNQEIYLDMQKEINTKFNYFKQLIRSGEFTLDQLAFKVANKWGAVKAESDVNFEDTSEENMDGIIKDIFEEIEEREKTERGIDAVKMLLAKMDEVAKRNEKKMKEIEKDSDLDDFSYKGNSDVDQELYRYDENYYEDHYDDCEKKKLNTKKTENKNQRETKKVYNKKPKARAKCLKKGVKDVKGVKNKRKAEEK